VIMNCCVSLRAVTRVTLLVGALAVVGGCSSVRETLSGQNAIDYQSTVRTDPLSIPPDLTQAAADPRYRAPATGSTTFTQFQSQSAQSSGVGSGAAITQVAVLPSYADIEVRRDKDLRWLVVKMPPEVLFPKIEEFWYENGFNLDVIDAKAGIMITNWAENRAKIPESWLRQALGSVLSMVWDSGQREKFRTVLERNGDVTEVFVSHQQMVEVNYGEDKSNVRWEHGREDPGLNAAMLARLMVYLGEGVDQARKKMAQAQVDPLKPAVQNRVSADGTVVIDETFDMAWRRVGLALDSGNFAVDDRDRSTGDFFVRYVDTDTGLKREEPSFFGRLLGAKPVQPAQQYRLHLQQQGNSTVLSVFNAEGKQDSSETAKRILSVLAERL
jgi:outer membrane protein assembly factor BamC